MFIPKLAHLGRYRQIAATAASHGLGPLVAEFGLGWMIPYHWGLLGHPRRELAYTRPEHLRTALAELGTTFIKLGQVLSTRSDLLSPPYVVELATLRDCAPPAPTEAIIERIEKELGAPVGNLFESFNSEPLASASIGQVHEAVLHSGESVVVKVQKPGVKEQVEKDLDILSDFASRGASSSYGATYDLAALVDEFAWALRGELDYMREGRNADLFRRNFTDEDCVYVPRIFWEYTTVHVLTMEKIIGTPFEEAISESNSRLDRKALASNLTRWILKQIFEDGFFHADPHPGNFFLMDGDVLGVVDFGMVGYIDEESRDNLLKLLQAIMQQDSLSVMDLMAQLGAVGRAGNPAALGREIHRVLASYYGLELGEMRLATMLEDLMGTVRRHRLHIPADLAVLLKTLIMLEGLVERIDPQFPLAQVLEPYAEETRTRLKAAGRWAHRVARGAAEGAALSMELPATLRRLMGMLERGDLEVSLNHQELAEALSGFNSMLRRLAAAVLVGSAIIAWANVRQRSARKEEKGQ